MAAVANIILDSAPLGLLLQRTGYLQAVACRAWAAEQMAAGCVLWLPEIIDFEIRRELLRLRKTNALDELENIVDGVNFRWMPLTSDALLLAAELWAEARQGGYPTADAQALDIDVILAAQALTSGLPATDYVVATSNLGHLSRFVSAELWQRI